MSGIVGDDGLTNEERNRCRDAFEKFDKDNSGAISDWELKQMLQCAQCLPLDPAAPHLPGRAPAPHAVRFPGAHRLTDCGKCPSLLCSDGTGPLR